MADKKISALPASTTPLAGTEVLPIVQSGATTQVSVANLTAGRAISATQLTLTTGNLIVASGQGIDFSATPGTGTSELLADYEEGTWTPAFGSYSGAFTSLTYSVQNGKYTKVGNQVTADFLIVVTAVTTGTAATILLITGLPFTPVSGVCVTTYQANFLTQGPDFGQFYGAGSNMLLRFKSLTSSINVDPTQVTNTTELQGSVTYFV